VTHGDEPGEGAPAALQQRRHQRALAVLPAMRHPALANGPAVAPGGQAGLCPDFAKVSRAARTGWARPDRLHALWPGSGGSAATAGATIQAVWDSQTRGVGHGALSPWTRPAQRAGDTGGPEHPKAGAGAVLEAPCSATPWRAAPPLGRLVAVASILPRHAGPRRRGRGHRWSWPLGSPP